MSDSRQIDPDFWLGDRGEGKVTDFDGRVRACRVLKRVRVAGTPGRSHLLIHVDPPLPLGSGRHIDHVLLSPRWVGSDLEHLPESEHDGEPAYAAVRIYEVLDDRSLAHEVVEASTLRADWVGEIARRPNLLPRTQEDYFETTFRLLEKFVAREGTADVPFEHEEGGVSLGVWVSNLRFEQANLGLRKDWVARLEALPGWKWLPGDDFFLLERYARREGTTRVPEDHMEEGRPLGRLVAQLRGLHASGRLAKDWENRLEAIPSWEW